MVRLAAQFDVDYDALRRAVSGRTHERLDRIEKPVAYSIRAGEDSPTAKLTNDEVIEARRRVRDLSHAIDIDLSLTRRVQVHGEWRRSRVTRRLRPGGS